MITDVQPTQLGVQPSQFLEEYGKAGIIISKAPLVSGQIQPASVDLRLGEFAYRIRASFMPDRRTTILEKIESAMDGHRFDLSADGSVLDRGQVYLIPLQESLQLPGALRGLANPKSSTGRLDVLVRLITEKQNAFDEVPAGYKGQLYVEVVPQTFSIVVKPGTRLNQLRLTRGDTSPALRNGDLRRRYNNGDLVQPATEKLVAHASLVPVTIDLQGDGSGAPVGFRAKRFTNRINLELIQHYEWEDYWDPIYARSGRLILDPGEFYILATRETVRVPPEFAAEMVAYESRSGEYRAHYAGFFDPGFGTTGRGSKAVLEVRSYIPFMLEHGQPIGYLRYEKLASPPRLVYGSGIGSNYEGQGLALAKQFKPYMAPAKS